MNFESQVHIDSLIAAALGNVPGAVTAGFGGRWDGMTAPMRAARAVVPANTIVGPPQTQPRSPLIGSTFLQTLNFDSPHLHAVPWLVPSILLQGDISVLTGLGASGKTAVAIGLSVAVASGRSNFGPFRFKTSPLGLKVAIISAEEDEGRTALLVAAACNTQQLTLAERANVAKNLGFHDACASGLRLGEPPQLSRDAIASEKDDRCLTKLRMGLIGVNLLVVDNLAAVFALPNENDNSAATLLMRRLAKLAREINCAVLLLHHTPKMSRESAATQRGEATLVRGGGGIANSARVVLTITQPPAKEALCLGFQGSGKDSVRRLEHAKINDALSMTPAFFEICSTPIRLADGSDQAVRAMRFLPPPTSSTQATAAVQRIVFTAVLDGALDSHGVKVPLSGAGRAGGRNAIEHIAGALMRHDSSLTAPQAKGAAKTLLADLMKSGAVTRETMAIPKYRSNGAPNGNEQREGLVAHQKLAPWGPQVNGPASNAPSAPPVGIRATP